MSEHRVNIVVCRSDGTLVAEYLLGNGEHLIGRDINCPVYLDSEYISSNHAKLYISHDGIQIEDLNSTSGTFLDGVPVRGKLHIKPDQVLQVADLTVSLQFDSRLGEGRYTLIRLLGQGGMGEVWLARDEQLQEEVALKKIFNEVVTDATAVADMRREVQKSRILSHPNIIRIHDLYVKAGENPLITLEYVDGSDLTAIAATKPNGIFGWEEIKDWMVQLAGALEYAHGEKIVHRDLKPANIMITSDNRMKLADFGIAATLVDSMNRSSVEGFVMGTTLYMSPQQMEGTTPKVTDDVYSFGVTLYELLTGKPPFYTGSVEHQVLNITPTPVAQRLQEFGFTNEIPEYVSALVMACLAKNPDGRFQSMKAIREWIQSEGAAKEAIPRPSTKIIKEPARVKRITYTLATIVAALIIGLGFWFTGQIDDLGEDTLQLAEAKKVAAEKAAAEKAAAEKAAAERADTEAAKAAVAKAAAKTELRKKQLLWEFETGESVESSPAIGADSTVYVGSRDKKIYSLNGKTGDLNWEFKTGGFVTSSPAIGADGTVYVGSWDKNVYALDGKTGVVRWKFKTEAGVASSPAIGADGTVYVGSNDNKVYAIYENNGTKKWDFPTGGGVYSSPAIGADGTIFVGSRDKKIYAIYENNGTKKWDFLTGGEVDSSPAIGADGTVYVGSNDHKVYALDGMIGAHIWEFVTGSLVDSSPAIGADGTVYIGSDKVYALDGKTGVKKWEFVTGGGRSSPAIGADGTVFVGSNDNKVYALDGKTGAKQQEIETGRLVVSSPVIGVDSTVYVGSIIYIGSVDKKVYAIMVCSKGLANSPWPMRGQNPHHTGRVMKK